MSLYFLIFGSMNSISVEKLLKRGRGMVKRKVSGCRKTPFGKKDRLYLPNM